MFERFTDRARKVMQLANQEAQRRNSSCVEPGDIMVGVIKEGHGVGYIVMINLGVEPSKMLGAVRDGMAENPNGVTMGKLPRTPNAERAINEAIRQSQQLGHNYVGTEHLLLGLFAAAQTGDVLRNFGLDVPAIRAELKKIVSDGKFVGAMLNSVLGKPVLMPPGAKVTQLFDRTRLDAIVREVADGCLLVPDDSNYLLGLIDGMLASGKSPNGPVEAKWYPVPENGQVHWYQGHSSATDIATATFECAVTPSELRALRSRPSYKEMDGMKDLVKDAVSMPLPPTEEPAKTGCTCDEAMLFFAGKCVCGNSGKERP